MFRAGLIPSAILIAILFSAAPARGADWNRGVASYKKGDYQAALAEFQQIAIEQPDAAGAWYYVGLCEFRLKDYGKVDLPLSHAIDLLQVQSPQSPDIAGAWYTIGFSHYLLADYEKAIEPLKNYSQLTAKAGKPVDQNARRALGRCYYFLERYDDAASVLAETSTSAPGQTDAETKEAGSDAYYLGAIYVKQGDDAKAIAALQQAVKDRPDDAAPSELLAGTAMRRAAATKSQDDWQAAVAASEQLVKLKDDLSTESILGRAYFGAKEFDKAVPPLEKVAKAQPSDGQSWLYYGIAASRSGQTRKAEEALEITIQLLPASLPALSELAYVYESNKQYEQALRIYEKAYEASGSSDQSIQQSIERVKSLAAAQH